MARPTSRVLALLELLQSGGTRTIAELADSWFDVMIVPFTWAHTHLPAIAPGDRVNLECDMIGKYVARAVETYGAAGRVAPAAQGSSR